MQILKGRRIALCVNASVSAYKALDIVSLLRKLGAHVRVAMSAESTKFLSPLLFEALSHEAVLHDEAQSWADGGLNPIALARWAEVLLVAPATANTINKIASGIADSALLHTALAFSGKILIAPAANTTMLESPITRQSLEKLRTLGIEIIPTQEKILACGEFGDGALADSQEIVWRTARALLCEDFWHNRPACISGGGSVEKIDDVRYLSNFSSGKMAQNLAAALYLRGANVCLVHSNLAAPFSAFALKTLPQSLQHEHAQSAAEFLQKLQGWIDSQSAEPLPYLFMAAAISDYRPENAASGKRKKSEIGQSWNLQCVQTPDILATLRKEGICAIGFKLESAQDALQNARNALAQKNLDAICLNTLQDAPFGSESNSIAFVTARECTHFEPSHKLLQSFCILDSAKRLHDG